MEVEILTKKQDFDLHRVLQNEIVKPLFYVRFENLNVEMKE